MFGQRPNVAAGPAVPSQLNPLFGPASSRHLGLAAGLGLHALYRTVPAVPSAQGGPRRPGGLAMLQALPPATRPSTEWGMGAGAITPRLAPVVAVGGFVSARGPKGGVSLDHVAPALANMQELEGAVYVPPLGQVT